ncbi:MAG: sensor histidine kinase [Janthinobacterium lividum]
MYKNNLTKKVLGSYDLNLRVITIAIISIVMILIIMYFNRSYAGRRRTVLQNISTEANNIENSFINDMNYSQYFINLIGNQLQNNHSDLNNIQQILQSYAPRSSLSLSFGWNKYSWVNSNFKETVVSTTGVESCPREPYFIRKAVENRHNNNITFLVNKSNSKDDNLKLILNIESAENGKYIGSIILSYDVDTVINRLRASTRKKSTNFVILNDQLDVVGQSKSNISYIIDSKQNLSLFLDKALRTATQKKAESFEDISYLDMLSGKNYHIRKIEDLPFILVTSLDSEEISSDILNNIIRRLVEISVFGLMFFLSVISIYRREIWLRTEAEQATITANKATKAKSDFLAFTAHEIRSPLGFILTGSEMMTKKLFGELPQVYLEYAEGIHQSSKTILDFITDILDENQIIEGKFKIINSTTNIGKIVDKAVTINKTRFNKRKVSIVIDLQNNLPKLFCDQRRILQVMNNLISNAIKYSNDYTKITIMIKVTNYNMQIEVQDQGIGMTELEIQSALTAWGIAPRKNYNLIESYGLGLPIVKMLLDAHEAELEIRSIPNIGTMVKIVFPKHKLIYD